MRLKLERPQGPLMRRPCFHKEISDCTGQERPGFFVFSTPSFTERRTRMFEQEEQRDELLEKIEDLISRKRYAELRDLLLPLEAQDIAGLFMELDDKVPMVFRLLPKERKRA